MANNCVIVFDQNECGTYFTGQKIKGRVIITLNKPKKFKGIKLQINGFAQCQWSERYGYKKPIHKTNLKNRNIFYGHEDYIASTTFLLGSEGSQDFAIDSGTHTYSFSCPIPINCPSSYEGTYGHIRYMIKVTFIRSRNCNRTHTKEFTVLKLLDLNREAASLRTPVCNESFENFCFFNRKAVHLRVNITHTGYVPGQMILVSSHVDNKSSADVKKLLITLNMRATYISDTPCMRTVSEKLCLVKRLCGPVLRHTKHDFAENIRVPATPPTCDYLSKIVRISYEIYVKAITNHLMSNPKIVIPITIGNIPLMTPEVEAEALAAINIPTASLYTILRTKAPPTYEEAMFMTTNATDDHDIVNTISETSQFKTHCPVYNIDNTVMTQTQSPNPPQI